MSKKPYYITTAITYTSMTYFSRQELTNMARK